MRRRGPVHRAMLLCAVLAGAVVGAAACTSASGAPEPPLDAASGAGKDAPIATTDPSSNAPSAAAPSSTTTTVAPREPVRAPRGDASARVVGYYAGWERAALAPASIPIGALTHVIYAFSSVTAAGQCRLLDPATERPIIAELQAWKAKAGVQTLLAVGGWEESRHFSEAASTPEGRDALATSCLAMARSFGFDGLDIDWEYPSGGKWPGRMSDPANYVALLTTIRERLAPGELLTIASPASPGALEGYGLASMQPLVDWFNVMAYDVAGPWDDITGHNAPIVSAHGPFGAAAAIAHYEMAGVPPAQLVLGVPFYGHIFGGVSELDGPTRGIGRPYTGPPRSAPTGSLTYRAIAPLVASSRWVRHWDPLGQVPWLVNERDGQLVSYDDPESLRAKVAFARAEGLGGMMIWELSGDTTSFTLLGALNDALGR